MTASMNFDVVVIGAGPAGLYAARRFAEHGYSTLVCEEHARVGDPVHCTGVVGAEAFDEFDLPRDGVLNELNAVRFVSPRGVVVSYASRSTEAVVIDRATFDRALAARAIAAGAEVRTGIRVTEL